METRTVPADLLEPEAAQLGLCTVLSTDQIIQLSIAHSLRRIADQLSGHAPGYTVLDCLMKMADLN